MSKPSPIPTLANVVDDTPQETRITNALRDFHVIRNPLMRKAVVFYPVLVVLVLVLDGLFFQGREILYDLVRVTAYFSVALASVFFVRLYDKVTDTLRMIWDRGVLWDAADAPLRSADYSRFVTEFEHNLNSRWSWSLVIVLLIAYAIVGSALAVAPSAITFGSLVRIALALLTWLLAGAAIWRLGVIGYMISRISQRFDLVVQPGHPDQAGGLQPLGDLCFSTAFVIMAPTIFLAGWIFVLSSPAILNTHPELTNFQIYMREGILQGGLVLLLLTGLIIFFLPLYEIHREMVRQRVLYQQRLDTLTRRMDGIAQQLLDPSQGGDSATAQKGLETLKWMRQVYEENERFPVWPFNRDIVLKLTTSQIVPLLTLSGLPKAVLDAAGNLLNVLQPK